MLQVEIDLLHFLLTIHFSRRNNKNRIEYQLYFKIQDDIQEIVMKKIVTMGAIMMRLSTPGCSRIVQAEKFEVSYGGSEANVAVSLANFGFNACFLTKLPENAMGQAALNNLRRFGVNTNYIARGGERLGVYYLETGASMRASQVVYDRKGSSISETDSDDFDLQEIFMGVDWFHFSGITPALSDKAAVLTEVVLKYVKSKNISVSCDLNYRKKLWSTEKAREVMTNLMQYVDVCIGNEEDAEKMLGFSTGATKVTDGKIDLDGYKKIFLRMQEKFKFSYIASTLRESYSASDNDWSALIYDGRQFYSSKKYRIHIIDRVGTGDSFAAGLICGLLDEKNINEALEFATAASALKHTIPGDFNHAARAEIEALTAGDGSGRVQR